MLNQCKEIDAPHPPHILQIFSPLVQHYKITYHQLFFDILINDVCAYVNANPVPWDNFVAQPSEVKRFCRSESLIEIFRSLYTLKAQEKNAEYWCCKSMANVYFIPEMEAEELAPLYIHLVRDGRDVAASFKNALVGEKHVYFIAKQWKKEQDLAEEYTQLYAPERCVRIKYEDLIRNPQTTLLPLLNKLNITWSDSILKYYVDREAKATAASGEMWQNVVKPVDSKNERNYTTKLSSSEIELFDFMAGETLQRMGYPVDRKPSFSITNAQLEIFQRENESLKREARQKFTHDVASRNKQEKILADIKEKLLPYTIA